MRSGAAVSAVALALLGATAVPVRSGGFYGLSARYADGFPPGEDGRGQELLDFASLRGKVVLVVNVASLCGYTDKDYRALAALHDRLARTGRFEVLAFPCNQFGRQEPWEEKEIVKFARDKYGAKFPIMEKVDVKGEEIHPVWDYLEKRTAVTPTWNFFKHLVDHRGRVTRTFLKGASWTVLERAVDVAVAEAAKAGREL